MTSAALRTIGVTTACALLAALAGPPRTVSSGIRPELQDLIAAVEDHRELEGRLSGGFRWAPVKAAQRTDDRETAARLRLAVAQLELRAEQSGDAHAVAAAAVGRAAIGDVDFAIRHLEEVTALVPDEAAWWSDLSAVYLQRAAMQKRVLDLPLALEAATRATSLDPESREAHFNAALALSNLGLTAPGAEAWQKALALEHDAAWRAEAEARRAALAAPATSADAQGLRERLLDSVLPAFAGAQLTGEAADTARVTSAVNDLVTAGGDASIVAAARQLLSTHSRAVLIASREYGRARSLYNAARYDEARDAFESSVRAANGLAHPLRDWAAFHIGVIDYLREDHARARGTFDALANAAPAVGPALQGHLGWMRGMLAILEGDHSTGLRHYDAGVSAFERAREPANAEFVRMLIAEDYDFLGDVQRAWEVRIGALRGASRPGAFLSTATSARANGWTQLAVALQRQSAEVARTRQRKTDLVDALRDLALTTADAGDPVRAHGLLREARAIADSDDDRTRDRLRVDLDLAVARCECAPPDDTFSAAARAVDHLRDISATRRIPAALLARASAYRRAGNTAAARADLHDAASQLEREVAAAPSRPLRARLAGEIRAVSDALASLEYAAGDAAAAIAAGDRSHGRIFDYTLAQPWQPREVTALAEQLPESTAILWFHITERETLVGHLTREGVTIRTANVDETSLARQVRMFARNPANRSLGRQLADLLLPASRSTERLIIAADGPLHLLPFAALPGRTTQFLIEEHALSFAPSLRWLSQRRAPARPPSSIVAIANPSREPGRFSALADLPGAEREARQAASHYAVHQIVRGEQATSASVRRALQTPGVVHFAGHAVINESEPSRSELVVSDSTVAPLTAEDLALTPSVKARLVVLAACNAGSGYVSRSTGTSGLAAALLAAGVHDIVASLALVNDDAASALFMEFHRAYATGANAADALRAGQLSLLRSGRADWAGPAIWGGFQAITAAAATTQGTKER